MNCEIKLEIPQFADITITVEHGNPEETFSTGREFQRRIKKELPGLGIKEIKFDPYTIKVKCELGSFKNVSLIILALRERFLEELKRAKG